MDTEHVIFFNHAIRLAGTLYKPKGGRQKNHPYVTATNTQTPGARPRRGRRILRRIGRGLKWLGIAILALAFVGVIYQTIATEIDKRNHLPPGQMIEVGGYRL
jgi:hypothetical protein